MAAYLIVDTKITDAEAYEAYKLRAKPIVESFGGAYLARGGNTTAPENELWNPTRLVIVHFPCSRKDKINRAFFGCWTFIGNLTNGNALRFGKGYQFIECFSQFL